MRKGVWLMMGWLVLGWSAWVYAEGVDQTAGLYRVKPNASTLKAGSEGKASFSILLKAGAKVHPQAPFQCAVSSSAGLSVSKAKLGHKDKEIKEKMVHVPVGVVAKGVGQQHVQMGCSFYICTKDICVRKEASVKIPVRVAAP
ncbi:hypothetical protein L6R29_09595 [Myxococcota bacterium]|nr:hypothetical protein [Myxococcota bacterium]